MDIEEFRKAAHAAVDDICTYFEQLKNREFNVQSSWEPGQIKSLIKDEAPETGEKWDDISTDIKQMIMPGITHWQHPRFFAYYPSNTTFESILGDMWATTFSNPGFNWNCSPVCTELEVVVTDWVAKMLGLSSDFVSNHGSDKGGGIILVSASDCVLTIIVGARERAISRILETSPETSRDQIIPKLVIYVTTETHSLGEKAGAIFNIRVRKLPTRAEDNWGLRGDVLENAIKEDTEEGLVPFLLIATLGSTSSGAIDNMSEIVTVSKKYPTLFVHVDAAWGGVFLSCPEYRDQVKLDAINEGVDSFCTNLHKSGLVAFDASYLCVRDRSWLTDALDVTPHFLRSAHRDAGTILDYRNMQLALGRRFRSLKIYFVLRSYGVTGFRSHLRKLENIAKIFEKIVNESASGWELFTPRRWSLVVIRFKRKEEIISDEQTNNINNRIYKILEKRRDVMFTQTNIGGAICLRVAVGSPFTSEEDIHFAWKSIQDATSAVLSQIKM